MYIILNKPVGYNTSQITPSLFELLDETHCISKPIPDIPDTLFSIDELEQSSEGLIVITDIQHNTEGYESEYEITIDKYLSPQAMTILKKGMNIEGKLYAGISIIEEKHKGKRSVVRINSRKTNDNGIRTMFEAIGYHVVGLRRIRIENFKLGVLSIGKWKYAA